VRRWFFNPYVQLGFDALLVTAGELLLKKGATSGAPLPASIAWLGFGALASGWTWLGILAYLLSIACWLYVLRHIPVSVAFGLLSITQVWVPLGAWVFLGEAISTRRWIGIASVLCGTVLIARVAIAKGEA
jgi:undecaprenyl phosphate-alpha-L-ara4N flippase subunit ArnF